MAEEGSCQLATPLSLLRKRLEDDTLQKFLDLVKSPFRQDFATDAFLASLGSSLGISLLIFVCWCFLRPYHSLVYAPKLRHADGKYAPPPVGRGIFSWLKPLMKCHEADLVDKIGMDATIFLRFMRLCRTLFLWLGLLGCVIMIPVNVSCNMKNEHGLLSGHEDAGWRWFVVMSPMFSWGKCMYAHVAVAWVFDFIIMYFLWRNYREVVRLRRDYFESREYMDSVHSRSLMIWDLHSSYRSDAGLKKIIGELPVPSTGDEKCAIGRNVKGLPALMEKHGELVRKLEKILAKYLKHPERLPPRPLCKPEKDDRSMSGTARVDAIDYYNDRIRELERNIYSIRQSIDKRDAMQYGFVSFSTVSRAHIAAKAARGKHPKGTSIALATKPKDIIWENIARPKAARAWNRFIGNLLFLVLSLFYVIPNALIAVFLSNLGNVAIVSPDFQAVMLRNPKFWAVVQGLAAPTITALVYILLPIVMRRISNWQGDITRSSRERHVLSKLYVFFVINNLIIFTLFGSIWALVARFIDDPNHTKDIWGSIRSLRIADNLSVAIFNVSAFWISYLLQRNMGAMLDLAQVVHLMWKSIAVRFLSPTPRQRIEWTAPPTFDYPTYYNYFLFYVTIALCFATVQPLVLPVAFLYFLIDSFLKKYTLMYVFVTKVESGGAFWRAIFNRVLFATGLANVCVGLIVWGRYNKLAAATILPLFLILISFKIYCRNTFDKDIRYYTRGSDRDSVISTGNFKRHDRLVEKYSHPALHEKLIKVMVAGKAQHLIGDILGEKKATASYPGTEGYEMPRMQPGAVPGTPLHPPPTPGFEVVQEEDMDFAHFKHRAEFGDAHGAGTIYADTQSIRTGAMTPPPGMATPGSSRPASPALHGGRIPSPLVGGFRSADYMPVTGQAPPRSPGFQQQALRPESPYGYDYGHTDGASETEVGLLRHSGAMGMAPSQPGLHPAHYESYEEYRGAHMR